jgi:hypothetical protein
MKFDKYKVWNAFMTFKHRLDMLKNSKNEKVIEFIKAIDNYHSEEFEIPEAAAISKATGIAKPKVLEIIRTLYPQLIETLYEDPVVISKASHLVWIHIPWNEMKQREQKDKEHAKYLSSLSTIIRCHLPIIPRVGDAIRLTFIDHDLGFDHGYVYEVEHEISGHEQKISVRVHPFKNIYKQWKALAEEYEQEEANHRFIEMQRANRRGQ